MNLLNLNSQEDDELLISTKNQSINRSSLIINNKFTELLHRKTNNQLLCSMFCGGRRCKYEHSDIWPLKDRAIRSIYSHWITENILAMSRPNTAMIINDNLIELFIESNIKTVINLQEPGEHSNCGPPLNRSSGFTYDPNRFMDHNIYFYNYKWKDYLDINAESLIDMVKVLTFAINQGRVAIHCHAGLGRTGTLIAAYLIYTFRCQVTDAINFVRHKRPNSIQTRSQKIILFKFANYIRPCFIVFNKIFLSNQHQYQLKLYNNTFDNYLRRQNRLLHGYELRILRFIPKIVFIICEKLLILSNNSNHQMNLNNFTDHYLSNPSRIFDEKISIKQRIRSKSESSPLSLEKLNESLDRQRLINALIDKSISYKINSIQQIIINELIDQPNINDTELMNKIVDYQQFLNNQTNGWKQLINHECNIKLLTALLMIWLENFDQPILNYQLIVKLSMNNGKTFIDRLHSIDMNIRYTLEYLARFLLRLTSNQNQINERLIQRFVASLTRRKIRHSPIEILPHHNTRRWPFIDRRSMIFLNFFNELIQMINLHDNQ